MSIRQKLRQRVRWAQRGAAFSLGLGHHWLRDRPGLRIVVYHGVVPPPVRRIHARFVSTEQLEAHLSYFCKRFQVVSLAQALLGEYDRGRMAVAVTFDDGYRNNLVHALPLLLRHRVPATVFVTAPRAVGQDILWPDLLDIAAATVSDPIMVEGRRYGKGRKGEYVDASGQRLKLHCKQRGPTFIQAMVEAFQGAGFRDDPAWQAYWQLLDAAELHLLSQADGIAIGGHGTLHSNLDRLPVEAAVEDVQTGIRWLEAATGNSVDAFAYPDGAYSPALVEALSRLGLRWQLLSEYRFHDHADARLRDRFVIHPFLPTRVLVAELLKGHYF